MHLGLEPLLAGILGALRAVYTDPRGDLEGNSGAKTPKVDFIGTP